MTSAIFSKKLGLLDLDEEEIARQLTLMDWVLFANAHCSEFLKKGWLETYQKNASPHIKQLRDRALRLGNWVRHLRQFTIFPHVW